MRRGWIFSLVVIGCDNEGTFGPAVDLSAQAAHAARRTGEGGFVAVEILPTRPDGTAIPCDDGTLDVTVTIAGDDGHFADVPPQTWRVSCDDGRTARRILGSR